MRILLIPLDYYRHKESPELFGDMFEAFAKKRATLMYDGDFDKAVAFKPDIIHFQGSLLPESLQRLKTETKAVVVMWTGDARYVPQNSLMLYKDIVDCYMLPFSGDTLKRYENILGKRCYFLWEPIQNWRFKQPKELYGGSTTFVGNLYANLPGGEKREELVTLLYNHTQNFEAYGNNLLKGALEYSVIPDLYNNAYITICENNYDDLDEYFTPRNIGAMAAGSCSLHRWFPGIEKHFENLNHCYYYRNKYELLEWIQFLYANPSQRNKTAISGHNHATLYYTYDNWVNKYLNLLKTPNYEISMLHNRESRLT